MHFEGRFSVVLLERSFTGRILNKAFSAPSIHVEPLLAVKWQDPAGKGKKEIVKQKIW